MKITHRSYREEHPNYTFISRLPECVYTQAIRSMVITDIDIVIIGRKKKCFYLAKRKTEPMPEYWIIGGRWIAGEEVIAGALRLFYTDTKVRLTRKRFQLVAIHEYLWKKREQKPKNVGSHNLCFTFAVKLTHAELKIATKNLNSNEYDADSGLVRFNRKQLVQHNIHKAIVDLYDQLFSTDPQ